MSMRCCFRLAMKSLLIFWLMFGSVALFASEQKRVFRAGAASVDITPTRFPVIVNGMFEERYAQSAADRLMARAIVLDDGKNRIAICVVDSLMLTRELLDSAKEIVSKKTTIPTDKILVSATHSHSAPSAMGCLGSGVDKDYAESLPALIAKSIVDANSNLEPAKIGWGVLQDWKNTHCRRWIRRPDKLLNDPFGIANVRANMHPGYQNPDCIGPSGPADPDFSVLSIRSTDNRPIAVLGNYAMHYFGSPLVSGDVCGRFGVALRSLISTDELDAAKNTKPPFVGILSQGTSGDIMWMDYSQLKNDPGLDPYTMALAKNAKRLIDTIEYRDWVPLEMAETKLKLGRRLPDGERLLWARKIVSTMHKPIPSTQAEIYAREQIFLHEEPTRELKLQAIKIGDLGICGIPNEVYALTGLKLKRQSPLSMTFNIELANGADGYIPPPEQHKLGGYTTWAARTAGLEVQAEPQIVESLLMQLEKVSGKSRKPLIDDSGDYSRAITDSKPVAYWRLNEMSGDKVWSTDRHRFAMINSGNAFYLPGPDSPAFSGKQINRAMHFAGGYLTANIERLKSDYSTEFWFWNGLPNDARSVTGYLFSRTGEDRKFGDYLAIAGKLSESNQGRIMLHHSNVDKNTLYGKTTLALKSWNHVVLSRTGNRVRVYLNGGKSPEIESESDIGNLSDSSIIMLGGKPNDSSTWEGKLDEWAVYPRAMPADEIAAHFAKSKIQPANK